MDNDAGRYCLSLIFGIDDFKLWFYSAGQVEQIVVPKGSLAVLSGQCVHGGARTNYSCDTYRLFMHFARTEEELPGENLFYPQVAHPDLPSGFGFLTEEEIRARNSEAVRGFVPAVTIGPTIDLDETPA